MKKVLIPILITLLLLAGIVWSVIAPVDRQPYQEQPYYAQTLQSLDSLQQQRETRQADTLQAGWSRRNITPARPLKLMGYGWKGDYETVHDSLMLRCFVFDDGQQSVALLSYDLMIVHPDLAAAIRYAVDTTDLPLNGLYFTAVHTHKGYGEWAKGLGGKLMAGGYSEKLVDFVARQTVAAVKQAYAGKRQVKIGYAAFPRPDFLRNRLTKQAADDNLLRVMKLEHADGSSALLCTFAAHATFINSGSMQLSADYPGALVRALEQDPAIDFAAFAAGAVGSHSPYRSGEFSYGKMQDYATRLAAPLRDEWESIDADFSCKMEFIALPLALGNSQLKISEDWRVRNWLFRAFFGNLSPEITALRLGDIVLLGLPADFSGMLYPELEANGLHLMVTSFNGSYIGYIIPDKYYHLPHREARELNWFGPHTGSYITEIINQILDLLRTDA